MGLRHRIKELREDEEQRELDEVGDEEGACGSRSFNMSGAVVREAIVSIVFS